MRPTSPDAHLSRPCLCLALALAAATLSAETASSERVSESNQIVAKINKSIITRRDVERQIADLLKAIENDPVKSVEEKLRESQVHFFTKLRELIGQELTVQVGRNAGVQISPDFVESQIRERADELEGLPGVVAVLSEKGMTLEDLRKKIEEDEIMHEVLLGTTGLKPVEGLDFPPLDTYVGPKETWEYYQKNTEKFRSEAAMKISMIVLQKGKPGKRAEAVASEVRTKALANSNFDALAREYSDVGKEQGGKLGAGEWVQPAKVLKAEFVEVVQGLPRGATSDIIETPRSYLLFHVDDRREAKVSTFAEVQDQVKGRLQQQRLSENFQRVQTKLLQDAYVWPESLVRGKER